MFLQMNPEERFDIEAINSIDFQALAQQALQDERMSREVVRMTKALMPRVQAETEEPTLVGAILRAKTLDWYRRSPSDPSWAETVPLRWGGIFHESRVPGGRLSRKLSVRLANLYTQCAKASGWGGRLRSLALSPYRAMTNTTSFGDGSKRTRGPLTQHVAQAYLDDLAGCRREGEQRVPLERLSEVARRNGSAEVNRTLAELFPQHDGGSLTVLDHRFHPDLNTLIIRVVAPRTSGDSATYDLVQPSAALPQELGSPDSANEASPAFPWEREDMTTDAWIALLGSLKKRKARLDPPPQPYRDRESYLGLRDFILADASARKAFQAVHWKGKPSGLVRLCRLLSEGTLAPEVETDGDYLEAELDLIDKGHATRQPNGGPWVIGHGWTVVREIAAGNVRTYRAERRSLD
ncbi:MAG: hypothetical protein HY557_00390 [Euryarchaeota archaeon]|nr:hypothetical protein [Euryarchaeota archaeon]